LTAADDGGTKALEVGPCCWAEIAAKMEPEAPMSQLPVSNANNKPTDD
jgi:hypothetical protein